MKGDRELEKERVRWKMNRERKRLGSGNNKLNFNSKLFWNWFQCDRWGGSRAWDECDSQFKVSPAKKKHSFAFPVTFPSALSVFAISLAASLTLLRHSRLSCKSRVATTTAKIVNSEKLCGRECDDGVELLAQKWAACPAKGRGRLQMSTSSTKEFPVVKVSAMIF